MASRPSLAGASFSHSAAQALRRLETSVVAGTAVAEAEVKARISAASHEAERACSLALHVATFFETEAEDSQARLEARAGEHKRAWEEQNATLVRDNEALRGKLLAGREELEAVQGAAAAAAAATAVAAAGAAAAAEAEREQLVAAHAEERARLERRAADAEQQAASARVSLRDLEFVAARTQSPAATTAVPPPEARAELRRAQERAEWLHEQNAELEQQLVVEQRRAAEGQRRARKLESQVAVVKQQLANTREVRPVAPRPPMVVVVVVVGVVSRHPSQPATL
jgi:chromosome segregation ATPase